MPVYAYKGVSSSGKPTRGTVSAENLRLARSKMRGEGVFLTEIGESAGPADRAGAREGAGSRWRLRLPRRIPANQLSLATRQLATLVGAAIPLVEALTALVEQVEHATLKATFAQVRERVNEGSSLADALSATHKFDTLYISMIRAGEASGALDRVLERIADYLEEQVRLTSKVTSIMVYPAAMLAFAGGVVVMLVTVVLPQITTLLEALDQELPFYTRWIINGSEFVRTWWWALLAVAIALAAGLRALLRSERGRAGFDRFVLRVPVLGKVVRSVAIARFSRTLSSLLAGGVGIVQALDISRHVANNAVIGAAITQARTSILEGASFAAPLRASGQFPPLVTTMVQVGERAGDLESMLAKVAQTYDEQVEATITRLTSLLEPLLILVMVGIVLVIILATLMPLLEITNSLR